MGIRLRNVGRTGLLSVRYCSGSVISAVPHDSGAVVNSFYGAYYWSARSLVHMVVLGSIMEPRMMSHRLGMSRWWYFFRYWSGDGCGRSGYVSRSADRVCKIWMETAKGGSKLAILLGRGPTESRCRMRATDATISSSSQSSVGS